MALSSSCDRPNWRLFLLAFLSPAKALPFFGFGIVSAFVADLTPTGAHAQYFARVEGAYALEFYDMDFSALADPAKRIGPLDALHYMPIGPDSATYLSFGGEFRQQVWSWSHEAHGLRGPTADTYDLSRLLIDAYLHLDRHLAIFVQLGRYDAFGKVAPLNPADASEGRLQQGFLELKELLLGSVDVMARLGRQEIALGSSRFVWVNDSSNIRTAHDGARLEFRAETGATLDLVATRPTVSVAQAFDDWQSHTGTFLAAYASMPLLVHQLSVDEYFFVTHTTAAQYAGLIGNETRETLGGRIWGSLADFTYDSDFAYQFGSFANLPIAAFGTSTRLAYGFPALPWRPALQFQTSYFSGSSGPPGNPRTIGTFDPPFPRATMLNYVGLETLENLIEAYPALILNAAPNVALRLGPEAMWRASIYDAVYVSRTVPLPATTKNTARYIGTNLVVAATWTVNDNLRIFVEYVHEVAGPAIILAGGHGSDAGIMQMDFNF